MEIFRLTELLCNEMMMYKVSHKVFGNHGENLAFDIEAQREILRRIVIELNLLIFML